MRFHNFRLIPNSTLLAVALFCLMLLTFARLPQVATSSEGREIQVAREILLQNNWILPSRNGVVPSKPPLFHWIVAGVGELRGGITVGMARTVSSLAAVLTLLLTVGVAGHLARNLGRSSAVACWWSCAVMTLTYATVMQAGLAMVDSVFSLCVTTAISSILLGLSREGTGKISSCAFFFFYLASAFAVLAKGPLGIALPLIISIAITVVCCGWRSAAQTWLMPRVSWFLFLLVALPWYLAAAGQGGGEFLARQIFFENLARVTGGESINSQAPWFYIPSLLRSAAPWSWLLIVVVWQHVIQQRNEAVWRRADAELRCRNGLEWSGLIWLGCGIALLSAASGKRHSYLLPLFPGLALYLGIRGPIWWQSLPHRVHAWAQRISEYIDRRTIWLLLLLLIGIQLGAHLTQFELALSPAIVEASIFLHRTSIYVAIIIGISCLVIFYSRSRFTTIWRNWYLASLVLVLAVFLGNGIKAEIKGYSNVADQIRKLLPADAAVLVAREGLSEEFDVVLMYLERPAQFINISDFDTSKIGVSSGPSNNLCESGFVLTSPTIYTDRLEKGDPSFSGMTLLLHVVSGHDGFVLLKCGSGNLL